ncbi:hypothetical protein D3C80_1822770 [compost metagenome]
MIGNRGDRLREGPKHPRGIAITCERGACVADHRRPPAGPERAFIDAIVEFGRVFANEVPRLKRLHATRIGSFGPLDAS